jgi:hypothetical protein
MKRTFLLLFLVTCLMCGLSYGGVLLDETWADGTRDDTNLPTESATWVSDSGLVTVGVGSFAFTQDGSSNRMWTHFAADGSPVTMSVGQQLVTTIKFTPTGLYAHDKESFRFGVFHDSTSSQVNNDSNDDGGGTGDPWADSKGYGVFLPLSNGVGSVSDNPEVGKHTGFSGTSLMGSSGDWTKDDLTSGDVIATSGEMHTITFELDYVSASQMDLIFTISDTGGMLSTLTISDDGSTLGTDPINTQFDHLFFRFSKAAETADVLDFHELKVELIPEPATMLLLGLGGLIAIRRKR